MQAYCVFESDTSTSSINTIANSVKAESNVLVEHLFEVFKTIQTPLESISWKGVVTFWQP